MASCAHPAERLAKLFSSRDYITGQEFDVVRCAACGLALTWPPPAPAELGRFYPDHYYGVPQRDRFPKPVELAQRWLYRSRARAVERLVGGPGRVLDVGCGRGLLLDAFRRRGWRVEGTELSAASSRYAREVLGIDVHLGAIEELALPAASFDAVTLWHVLEHMADPARALAEVARLLRPGGVLLVSVPNFASVEARIAGPGWFHLDVPRHLVHFAPDTLRSLLGGAGLTEVEASWFAPEFDSFSFVQSALNRVGIQTNLLYGWLRRRGARSTESPSPGHAIGTALLAPALALAAPLVTTAAAVLRQGTTLSLLARRAPPTVTP